MKPGATTRPAGIDDRARVLATERTDGRDAVTGDADVGADPRSAGAVHHASAGNEDVEPRGGGRLPVRDREGGEACDRDEYDAETRGEASMRGW